MSILKKHVAHPVALLAAIATLASGLTSGNLRMLLRKSLRKPTVRGMARVRKRS